MKNSIDRYHLPILLGLLMAQLALLWPSRFSAECLDKIVPHHWVGSPGAHEYIQEIELQENGQGRLVYGDSQVIRHDEKIRFRLRALGPSLERGLGRFGPQEPSQQYLLEFDSVDPEYGRHYSGQFESQTGRYQFEEEYSGRKLVYRQRITFQQCPFGFFRDKNYYGYLESGSSSDP